MIRGIRHDHPGLGLGRCCRLLGLSRQAYYQYFRDLQAAGLGHELAIREVLSIRALQPAIGGRKLYAMLAPFLLEHRIRMGRDGLFDLLAAHGLLIRRKRRRAATTYSGHWLRKYPNLIRDRVPTGPNQIWVSDITYYMTASGFVYISFITDAYSRKIVGYHVADTLEAVHTLEALKNAIAERLNGIMKAEFLDHYRLDGLSDVARVLERSVTTYNTLRPHMSCGMLTPENVHVNSLVVERKWKNYYPKKTTFVNPLQD